MKVLKHMVLVKPQASSSLIVELEPDRGEVVAVGQETEVANGDQVFFGTEFEKMTLRLKEFPETQDFLLMHESNIRIFFPKEDK